MPGVCSHVNGSCYRHLSVVESPDKKGELKIWFSPFGLLWVDLKFKMQFKKEGN